MAEFLQRFFRSRPDAPLAAVPEGERVYAIGDIHGRLDLFRAAIAAIESDDAARGPADTTIVLLGDLIDRGPDSSGVIAFARDLSMRRNVRIIAGNHEEIFLASFYKLPVFRNFLKFGGRETILSYGVNRREFLAADVDEEQALMTQAVPMADREFLLGFEKMVAIGDYLFVHAGINPDRPIDMQRGYDCRWIREPFLNSRDDFGRIIVHGHTVTEHPDVRHNRIGIDTGAYMSGRLTALGLEGTDRWFLESIETGGDVATVSHAA